MLTAAKSTRRVDNRGIALPGLVVGWQEERRPPRAAVRAGIGEQPASSQWHLSEMRVQVRQAALGAGEHVNDA